MNEPIDLYCKIFVKNVDKSAAKEVMELAFQGIFERNSMYLDRLVVDVHDNPDATESGRTGEDFLFWPVIIELDAEGRSDQHGIVMESSRVLKLLWSSGYPAVAACDFEDQLPWNGGILRDFADIEGSP